MERNLRKTRVGVVVSDKMDKTIVVAVKDSVPCGVWGNAPTVARVTNYAKAPNPAQRALNSEALSAQHL